MEPTNRNESLEALQEIRSIMDRSARFISLSGWSGIWAGCTALAGAAVAYTWLQQPEYQYMGAQPENAPEYFSRYTVHFILLAAGIFITALLGGLFFTYRRANRQGNTLWNNASRQMLLSLFFPIFAGGAFSLTFVYYGSALFVAPACLVFYGLALISASNYTLSDIQYLGMLDVALGCANLFFPGYGLYFWAFGFGVLHIFYGIVMSNKYDKSDRR